MGLVNGKEGDFDMTEQVVKLCQKLFGRHIEDLDGARQAFPPDKQVGSTVITAVQGFGINAVGTKGLHLVFHQADQRGYDHNRTWQRQCRNLIADAFSTTCRHQYQRIVSCHHMTDNRFLVLSKGFVPKIALQSLKYVHKIENLHKVSHFF